MTGRWRCLGQAPKILEPQVQFRPIVSCIGLLLHQLSEQITFFISPLAGQIGSHVKNSWHFTEMMKDVHGESDEIFVSFDVSSLFTNIL